MKTYAIFIAWRQNDVDQLQQLVNAEQANALFEHPVGKQAVSGAVNGLASALFREATNIALTGLIAGPLAAAGHIAIDTAKSAALAAVKQSSTMALDSVKGKFQSGKGKPAQNDAEVVPEIDSTTHFLSQQLLRMNQDRQILSTFLVRCNALFKDYKVLPLYQGRVELGINLRGSEVDINTQQSPPTTLHADIASSPQYQSDVTPTAQTPTPTPTPTLTSTPASMSSPPPQSQSQSPSSFSKSNTKDSYNQELDSLEWANHITLMSCKRPENVAALLADERWAQLCDDCLAKVRILELEDVSPTTDLSFISKTIDGVAVSISSAFRKIWQQVLSFVEDDDRFTNTRYAANDTTPPDDSISEASTDSVNSQHTQDANTQDANTQGAIQMHIQSLESLGLQKPAPNMEGQQTTNDEKMRWAIELALTKLDPVVVVQVGVLEDDQSDMRDVLCSYRVKKVFDEKYARAKSSNMMLRLVAAPSLADILLQLTSEPGIHRLQLLSTIRIMSRL